MQSKKFKPDPVRRMAELLVPVDAVRRVQLMRTRRYPVCTAFRFNTSGVGGSGGFV